jgi:hypothetical protein
MLEAQARHLLQMLAMQRFLEMGKAGFFSK